MAATDAIADNATLYAGYAEGKRVPAPSEIECQDPERPCLLPSSRSADPPTLKQVVAHAFEAGRRGVFDADDAAIHWHLGGYRTRLEHDIYGVATSARAGCFSNIDATRRQGIEAGLRYASPLPALQIEYSLVDATMQTPLTLASPNNPFADEDGHISVQPGDRLPDIPRHQIKFAADYTATPSLRVGAVFNWFGEQYARGDESNQNAPLHSYRVLNLHASYSLTEQIELFADVRNLLEARYDTFGQYGDPTGIGAPGIAADAATNDARVNNRFLSPGPPRSALVGARVRL